MAPGKGLGVGFFRGRYVWMVFSAILVAAIIGFSFYCVRLRDRLTEMEAEREILLARIGVSPGSSFLTRRDIAQLERYGIADPEADLASDLMQHRELIPYEGVMGGTMGFYSKRAIHILSSRWVLAAFEDGHIGGKMLLEYRVDPGGNIHWRVIEAYLD
jgi:hypothetical protein